MKALINSVKRTHWFKASVAFLTCLLFLISPSCQKDESEQDYLMSPSASSKKVKLTGKVKDVDGNWYKTVKIGEQWWMAENLRTTRYNNKTPIPNVTDITAWSILTTGAYSFYENSLEYGADYGAMYNWFAVADSRKLCPSGWRVPTEAEWITLQETCGERSTAGGPLKEAGYDHWLEPNLDATNASGFTALPGGYRDHNGNWGAITYCGLWWSVTEYDEPPESAFARYLGHDLGGVSYAILDKRYGLSVRCIQGN